MNQINIGRFRMSVGVNGYYLFNLPITIPEGVESLNWLNDEKGYIFYNDCTQEEITVFPEWAQQCVNIFNENYPKPNPEPTPEELNKQEASNMLYATDWTTIPDITDPAKCTPHLTNQADFLAYRNQLRAIAINPPTNLVTFPPAPKPKWG